jgi:Fe-S cluster biogenesis protein NfuA
MLGTGALGGETVRNEFEQRLHQLETLIGQVEAYEEEEARRPALDAIQLLLQLHSDGLERMLVSIGKAGPSGEALIAEMAGDEIVGGLLLLHDLHPIGLEARIRQALDNLRPYLASHGADVDLLSINEDGEVGLRLHGGRHGVGSSAIMLRYAIEEAILEAAPDITSIHVEGVIQPAQVASVPLSQIKGNQPGPSVPVPPMPNRPAFMR